MNIPTTSFAMKGVRDCVDAREAAARYFADCKEGAKNPRVGMHPSRSPKVGQGTAAPGCTPRQSERQRLLEACQAGDENCDYPPDCGGDILGFHSLGVAAFPVAGAVAPAITASPVLQVNSGHACAFRPRKFFFEARDQAAGFVVVASLLTSVVIAGNQQLTSNLVGNAITSAVFALTCEPLPVGWRKFKNTPQQNLELTFGNFQAVAVTTQYFGVAWGDEVHD